MALLSAKEKAQRRDEVQKFTYDEVLELLKKYNRCIMVRPTGFGKTYIMLKVAKSGLWDRVIFVSPRKVITNTVKAQYKRIVQKINIKFISYQKLSRDFKKGNLSKNLKLDNTNERILFLFDEAHFMGAEDWGKAIKSLMLNYPEFYYLGATATPKRFNNMDVTVEFFDNIKPFTYTRHMAISEGLLNRPYYVTGQFEISNQFVEEVEKVVKKNSFYLKNEKVEKVIKDKLTSKMLYMNKLNELSWMLKKYIPKYIPNTDYMKFLVYFPKKDILFSKKDDIVKWFETAFPDMIVDSTVVITDQNRDESLEKVLNLEVVYGKIDLIFCIDMISYGYHVEDLTGQILCRYTDSNILFNQQIGRCFSVMDDSPKIIFDLVGNHNAHPLLGSDTFGTEHGGNGTGGDDTDGLSSGDVINVTEDKEVDVNALARTFDPESISREMAIVRAMRRDEMNIDIAMKEFGTSKEKVIYDLMERYKDIDL